MHVVHCLTHSDRGGGQVAVYNLVHSLRRWFPDVRLSVVLPTGGVFIGRFKNLGVQVREFGFDAINPLRIRSIISLLHELKPDVVHSHGKGAGLYVRSLSRDHLPARRFHSHHGFHPPKFTTTAFLYMKLERYLFARTDKFVAVSPSEGNEIRLLFPEHADKVHVVPNMVDAEETLANASAPLDAELGRFLLENKECFVCTMIARDDPVKNYPLALASARQVLESKQNVAFIFVGISGSAREFRQLRDSFPSRVFGIPYHDVPEAILDRSHCVLLTSKKEGGLPLVIQEAFCLGKPAVATDVEGIGDLVHSGENGILCNQTRDSISGAILALSADAVLHKKLSEGARAFSRMLDQQGWAKRYYDLYSEVR